ncbi:TPA: glycosyltransferase family 2 protein [Acinetobacter baumannii]|uniref:glycosyltransferase family 2 protein n=1 Tax=Acinetobacter TaxID=469 RepID=UPI000CE2B897|nr:MULTISPECIES: glycosyltransferase family 2 protein [Acinetobacter]ELA7472550.1 glycosyltransferase family 2 protein [Acinetobacter baumannii]MBJ9743168.1 glycosyltransferase family 2 protein [Acinetobacter baumannii]MBK5982491.1 glycosyltransferase family 2 protein [Acinetobacter baumannii]MCU4351354.1 glycosyltransferase family 2 protein [Acinetobacter ursingii]MCU4358530.1 glycosyltransferase family 2 protein [Acinetobacter ursingii]
MQNKLITVLIPVYNVEAYVEKAITSICNQTYRNLQIIIIDDCSTDNTVSVVEKLAKIDNRILLLKNNINSKIVKTLNFGLKYAKGDYIARMDGDDTCTPERLEKQLKFLLENPEYSLVGSHVNTIDENDVLIGKLEMPTDQSSISKNLKYSSPVLHIWLAKSEVYKKLEGYREIPGAEDYDFLLRMYTENFKFTNLNSFEYSVRIRDGNTTSTIGFNQRLMSNYVVQLFNERNSFGVDSYSNENVEQYLNKYSKLKKSFDKSNIYLKKAFEYKVKGERLRMLSFIFMAIITSRFQFQYLLKRMLFKFKS